MKNTKVTLFSLAMVAVLAACNNTPKKTYNITLINPEDTSMVTSNVKQYIHDMRMQEIQYQAEGGDIYKIWDLYGDEGIDIDEDYHKVSDENRVYLDTGDVNGKNATVKNSTPDRSDKNTGVELKFEVKEGFEQEEYAVSLSTNENFENSVQYTTKENSINIQNLYANTQYYWKVRAGDETSDVGTFTTGDYVRWISARPVYNVRDLGGYMTESGKRVKQGLIYRGGEITNKAWGDHSQTNTPESMRVFYQEMEIGIELDLRGAGDIGDGYNDYAFRPDQDRYKQHAIKSYEETFTKTRSEVAPIFELLANADNEHVYFHCYGGADRTGTIGFLLNGLLGVSYSDLVIDFELTSYSSINNEHIRSHLRRHQYDRWDALINQIKTDTTGGYAYDENALLKDNLYNFLNKACSVPTETLDTIRDIMIEK